MPKNSRLTEFDLWWGQGIFGQGPAAIAIYERLKSRVRDHLRALKPAKYQPIEFKVFPADMSNDVDLRGTDDERPHVKFPTRIDHVPQRSAGVPIPH
jgi:hypothetical protein